MSPALNGSSALQCVELGDVLEICNGTIFDFYQELPHMLQQSPRRTYTYHLPGRTNTLLHTTISVEDSYVESGMYVCAFVLHGGWYVHVCSTIQKVLCVYIHPTWMVCMCSYTHTHTPSTQDTHIHTYHPLGWIHTHLYSLYVGHIYVPPFRQDTHVHITLLGGHIHMYILPHGHNCGGWHPYVQVFYVEAGLTVVWTLRIVCILHGRYACSTWRVHVVYMFVHGGWQMCVHTYMPPSRQDTCSRTHIRLQVGGTCVPNCLQVGGGYVRVL